MLLPRLRRAAVVLIVFLLFLVVVLLLLLLVGVLISLGVGLLVAMTGRSGGLVLRPS